MRDGFRIADADRHVMEPFVLWREYLEPAFRDRGPALRRPARTGGDFLDSILRLGVRSSRDHAMIPTLDGRPIYQNLSPRSLRIVEEGAPPLSWGPLELASTHVSQMDAQGIDV